ncbi:hypothetical protein, partial [Enterococcus casseliflavus]|uniref:hypothetical protein n=1 Tax=Enterococcus casseliflavus TaxID=37734 RepID=UPI003D0B6ED1
KQIESHGLTAENLSFNDEALHAVVRSYTREAGVRNFERELQGVIRKVVRRVVLDGKGYQVGIGAENLGDYLGVARFRDMR